MEIDIILTWTVTCFWARLWMHTGCPQFVDETTAEIFASEYSQKPGCLLYAKNLHASIHAAIAWRLLALGFTERSYQGCLKSPLPLLSTSQPSSLGTRGKQLRLCPQFCSDLASTNTRDSHSWRLTDVRTSAMPARWLARRFSMFTNPSMWSLDLGPARFSELLLLPMVNLVWFDADSSLFFPPRPSDRKLRFFFGPKRTKLTTI